MNIKRLYCSFKIYILSLKNDKVLCGYILHSTSFTHFLNVFNVSSKSRSQNNITSDPKD